MIVSEYDTHRRERIEPPTKAIIEQQRQRQLEAIMNIRRLLVKATQQTQTAA